MLNEYKMQAFLGVWGGAVFCAMGYFFTSMPHGVYRYFGFPMILGGLILFISGCVMYAKGKGRNGCWGFLGICGPLGLLILYCLKDKSKMILKKRLKSA